MSTVLMTPRFSLRRASSTSTATTAAATASTDAAHPPRRRAGGELGDGDELVALLGAPRRGSAAAASAVWLRSPPCARAVGVVEQQDRAGPEALDASAARSCRRRAAPCPRRPSSSRRRGSRASARRRRPTGCGSRGAPGTGAAAVDAGPGQDPLGLVSWSGDVGRAREGQQRVVEAVRGDLVALVADPPDDLGVRLGVPAEDEERRARVARAERVEDARRHVGGRPVVEGDRERPCGRTPLPVITAPKSLLFGREARPRRRAPRSPPRAPSRPRPSHAASLRVHEPADRPPRPARPPSRTRRSAR